jgi:glycosyltransferase involved in cell wall biosynthesis
LFIEDLNKVPLFAPYFAQEPLILLVHHLFGPTAFLEAGLPLAAATWLLEKPLPFVYKNVPVIAVSESTALDLTERGFDRQKITVIPNGVDLDFYHPIPQSPKSPSPTVLYLGRLKKYKRVDLIIRAFARVVQKRPDAQLIIAGKGTQRPELEGLAQRLGVKGKVHFAGFVTDEQKQVLFNQAWVHMLTSPKEGWGITNIEAAACGTPTIASDAPGLRDSVENGKTGFLVPHADVEALASRLQEVIDNRELRERLGRQAHAFAQQFAWDETATRMENFLTNCLSSPSR